MRIFMMSEPSIPPSATRAVKLIRIEGKNLDHVKRSNIKAR